MEAFPGLIDCHVHFREPGLEHKATIASEASAARSGGVFVCCEMPNTTPPTNSIERLKDKVERADHARDVCDVRFFFGATVHEHLAELEQLLSDPSLASLRRHCCGLKLYLDNSTGDMKSEDDVTEAAFALCGKYSFPLVAHCEHAGTNDRCSCIPYTNAASHSERRPAISEVTSIREAISRAEKHNTPLHIAHLSTAEGMRCVKDARERGVKVTCEVTPHHLLLTVADYDTLGGRGKVNPPIRYSDDQELLWDGVIDGTIDCIATDHAPHLLSEKDTTDGMPPSGLPGVEVSLRLLLSIALGHWPHPTTKPPASALKLTTEMIRRLMFTRPNEIFDLHASDAPAIRIDKQGSYTITNENQKTKCGWTPYNGWEVKGDFSLI
uniref:Dihydroorotase n=1 Tax=Parabodo caudatus TaxID=351713 RepID=A9CQ03_9EUGL|nr:dihydroorotase [Parabodo caudatus]